MESRGEAGEKEGHHPYSGRKERRKKEGDREKRSN